MTGDLRSSARPTGPAAPSPLRYLLVLVPLLVIAVAGTNLLGVWGTAGQQAARDAAREAAAVAQSQAAAEAASQAAAAAEANAAAKAKADAVAAAAEAVRGSQTRAAEASPPQETSARPMPLPMPKSKELAAQDSAAGDGLPTLPNSGYGDAPGDVSLPFDVRLVEVLLLAADAEAGAVAFKPCRVCHTFSADGVHKIGPNLWGVVGRPKGSLPGFLYSQALTSKGGIWSPIHLARYINNPRKFLPGTSMAYRGTADNETIANIIAYLETGSGDVPAAGPSR